MAFIMLGIDGQKTAQVRRRESKIEIIYKHAEGAARNAAQFGIG